jgi:N-acetylmuramoyl-L-alanine amidase
MAKVIALEQPAMLADSAGVPVPSAFVGTVNFNMRKPNYVIIHFTAQDSLGQTLKTFTVVKTQVSAHYVVGKDGKVVHMLNDYLRAWHAGISKWGSISDMNSCSIGIEIDNNGNEPFTDPQIKSLLALLAQLKKAYNIPTNNFIGHQDIAPLRKPDPGPFFPWKVLAQHGFGYWSDDVLELAPDNFDYTTALRLIGYDTSNITAAIVAFKRHFVQTDISPSLTQLDLNVLYNIYQKY